MTDRVGIGWRGELAAGILSNLDRIDVLEVIADDNYFIPFNSEYITELSKKIQMVENAGFKSAESPIKIIESTIKGLSPAKNTTIPDKKINNSSKIHAKQIIKNMSERKINIFKSEHKKLVVEYIQKYIKNNKINNSEYDALIKEIFVVIIR